MTETTFTAADMRAAWEAGRDAALSYVQYWRNIPSHTEKAHMADEFLDDVIQDIRALTPPSAALAEGNKP